MGCNQLWGLCVVYLTPSGQVQWSAHGLTAGPATNYAGRCEAPAMQLSAGALLSRTGGGAGSGAAGSHPNVCMRRRSHTKRLLEGGPHLLHPLSVGCHLPAALEAGSRQLPAVVSRHPTPAPDATAELYKRRMVHYKASEGYETHEMQRCTRCEWGQAFEFQQCIHTFAPYGDRIRVLLLETIKATGHAVEPSRSSKALRKRPDQRQRCYRPSSGCSRGPSGCSHAGVLAHVNAATHCWHCAPPEPSLGCPLLALRSLSLAGVVGARSSVCTGQHGTCQGLPALQVHNTPLATVPTTAVVQAPARVAWRCSSRSGT